MTQAETQKIWEKVKKRLGETLPYTAFESWIKPVQSVSLEKKVLTLSTNSNLSKEWIYKNYSELICKILKEITKKHYELKITITNEKTPEVIQQTIEEQKEDKKPKKNFIESSIPLSEFQIDALKSMSNNLNLKYTFENFVIGTHNKFAYEAALAVAKKPAENYNPLFIYGGSGLGKTHLMQAIGHYILVNHPELKIKYTNTETFTNELINSIRGGGDKMTIFRQKYRHVDVLLLDDIQFIEGKNSTQEEVFHTFEFLHSGGKQIIITSDRPPKNIATLTDRLRSRFEWGLLSDIQVPDVETRIAILKNKTERDETNVPDDVLELIAGAYKNNIRELEGALNRVVAYVSINECAMTVENIKKIIQVNTKPNTLTIDKIIEETGLYFKIEPSEIKSEKRSKDISNARQIAIYLTREITNSSFPTIGEAFGGRKHTTILYAYEKMKEEIQTNRGLSDAIGEIELIIKASL